MNIAPVFSILGVLLTILSATMLIPMLVDISLGYQNWFGFASAALISCFVGISLWLTNRSKQELNLGLKEAFLLTNSAWVLSGIFGALHFFFLIWGLALPMRCLSLFRALPRLAPPF